MPNAHRPQSSDSNDFQVPSIPTNEPPKGWAAKFLRRLRVSDAIAIALSVAGAHNLRFVILDGQENAPESIPFWIISLAIGTLWWGQLSVFKTRDLRVLGAGAEEYKRLITGTIYYFGLLGLLAYLMLWDLPRGYILTALLLGLLTLSAGRVVVRGQLVRLRKSGRAMRKVVVIGGPSGVAHLTASLKESPEAGYMPVAAILPGYDLSSPEGEELAIPVVNVSQDVPSIITSLSTLNTDAVLLTSGNKLKARQLRHLGWELAQRRITQIMAPALTDISGPRIHQQPVAGMALLHVSTPRFSRLDRWVKRSMDIIGSLILLVALSPLFLAVAIIQKATDPGPVFFSHKRIGQDGYTFQMHKFRSMVVDAESRLEALKMQHGNGALLFKMKDDPRVTSFGRFMRRYSIDELPQLWNVLVGDMSLIGPRPQVRAEVDEYDEPAFRRLMVKPGMTGLWQVSGRSNLSVEEAIRLDLFYVENWSPVLDLVILAKTARAVVAKDGAY